MINIRALGWAVIAASALMIVSVLMQACGKFTIEHDVSGTVQVQVSLTPALFLPFFLKDCQTRVVGQACYDPDATVCATCMADALFSTLPVIK